MSTNPSPRVVKTLTLFPAEGDDVRETLLREVNKTLTCTGGIGVSFAYRGRIATGACYELQYFACQWMLAALQGICGHLAMTLRAYHRDGGAQSHNIEE
ncbi:hypothetical protein PGTUg99_006242 [Puccinia graminis f. sp. tritici]|uniref:Uncharacterized protein n=1 Tax=Puccinia graminis f. sp. tritici TaxID=56615 RepID=A0A5B0RCT5_PUCGR|nr:hypothetical protein PGTUg99_006242 [Puccinia graminis f. sp. tritici]